MITGANSGIGRATAMAVAQKGKGLALLSAVHHSSSLDVCVCVCPGGTVHMVCRNKERAEEAREAIVRESGNTVSDFKVVKIMTCGREPGCYPVIC